MGNEDYKILFADDENDLRDVVGEILMFEGYSVDTASNGAEAIEMLKKFHYDLFITDFEMPVKNGAEVLFWCRENGLHIPVIFMTANAKRLPIEIMALRDCCTSLIQKPTSVEEIVDAVDAARERAHDRDCLFVEKPDVEHFHGQHVSHNELH